jgi:predicted RNA-binding Zn-ribbon protein involved in translation (DUF1610 family)
MSTTIASLQNEVLNLKKTMESVNQMMQSLNDQIKLITEAEEFDVFVQQEITPYFGESTAENIIKMLQKCRKEGNNYQFFTPVYQWKSIYGNLEKRQLLKLISAVYRIKYQNPLKNTGISSLKSDIKYAKECPECGRIASAFYTRLLQEGLIK